MVQREFSTTEYECPVCNKKLIKDDTMLRCEMHGAFFAYGPHLLVRVPEKNANHSSPLLPWERREHDER
jgi:hypothetical protein